MEYKTYKVKEKPNKAPKEFCVYATGCRIGLWSNGIPPHVYLLRTEPTGVEEEVQWRELRNIPSKSENLADVNIL